jgi:hypothetical protein
MPPIKIAYRFIFRDGRVRSHEIELSAETGMLSDVSTSVAPAWAALDHKKCKHCPLKSETVPVCPVAKNLGAVAADFKNELSYDVVTVEVVTKERDYRKELPLQKGLFGLFGLIMATSACPYFEFLRPMARFHLPFATSKETMARSVSFYLLRQYFVARNGGQPDFELTEFANLYKNVEEVNLGIINRIRSITTADAEANSIVILDGFAKLLSMELEDGLKGLEQMFSSPA